MTIVLLSSSSQSSAALPPGGPGLLGGRPAHLRATVQAERHAG